MTTIIILLILASVSIVALRNTDLFGKTQQATEYYKQQAEIENETLESYGRTLNEYLEGRASGGGSADVPFDNSNLNKTSARLGKTINYTTQPLSDSTFTLPIYPGIEYRPDGTNAMSSTNTGRTETLTWKVLSEDTNGNLLITTTTPTTAKYI